MKKKVHESEKVREREKIANKKANTKKKTNKNRLNKHIKPQQERLKRRHEVTRSFPKPKINHYCAVTWVGSLFQEGVRHVPNDLYMAP